MRPLKEGESPWGDAYLPCPTQEMADQWIREAEGGGDWWKGLLGAAFLAALFVRCLFG